MYPSTGVPASNLRPTSRTLPYLRVILGGLRTVIRPWASRAGIRYRRRYRRQICNWLTRILKAGRWVVGRWRNIDRNRIGICDGLRIRSGQENGGPGKNPKSKDQSIVTIAMSDHGDRHHRLPAIIAGRKLSYMLSAIIVAVREIGPCGSSCNCAGCEYNGNQGSGEFGHVLISP